ncbi:hypothetical protein DASB73_015480 [Starmerella bacillaris]|uniref:Uncharacterized protein n=1 Tax=Starmerella bacillaris TaxID=1247836 RepID=A0AAV5RGE3_STABA|nr:hypothetical protein DASB73_015480 [Starmerella bacillaris]
MKKTNARPLRDFFENCTNCQYNCRPPRHFCLFQIGWVGAHGQERGCSQTLSNHNPCSELM